MVRKVGVLVPHLYDTQLAFNVLAELNDLVLRSPMNDASVFFEDLTPYIIKPLFGVYNAAEIFHFDGDLIATTLQTAASMLTTLKPKRKFFYVWSLEWLEAEKNYIKNIEIYQNPDLELIAPSDDYAKEIKNYCGILPRVVKNLEIESIL